MPFSNRLTPATEEFLAQQAAVAESNQQAGELDIVGQQQEAQQRLQQQLKDQASATAAAQRAQATVQKQQASAQKAQIAAAQRAGVKTQVDATGSEQIQRHEDNTPVFEHGFQGDVQQDPSGQHFVKYRTPRGGVYTVPTKDIRTTQDPTGNALYEFDATKEDGTKETIRQPVGTKPLWQTDPKTGKMYTGAADPTTGSYGQTEIGIDRTVAGKAAIERQKEAFKLKDQEFDYQSKELTALQNAQETNLKPLKTSLSDAQDAYDKLAKDKIQFKQTPAGLVRVVDYGNGPQDVPIPGTDTAAISSAQAWINQKAAAEKKLAEAKAAHEPVAAQVFTMQQQRDKLALDALRAGHEAQKQLKSMEDAQKAGIPVYEPDWQKRVDAARVDPRITGIVTQGNLDEQGGPLAEDVRTIALPETTKLLNRAFANASPVARSGMLPDGSPVQSTDAAGVPMARPGLNLLNQVMDGIAADNVPVKDADVRTLTTQALGITNPEKWEARPSEGVMGEMGYHDLITDGEQVGRFNTKANRIELDNPTGYSNQAAKQQQRLINTNKDGLPIYFAGAEQAMTKPQIRDMVRQGIDIASSTTDPQQAEAELAEAGLSPAALRQKVMDGKISVQDGRLFNQTFHGLSDVDGSEDGITRAFSKHLASPVLGAMYKNGDLATRQQVVNQFMDAYAERAGSNIITPARSDLAAMRSKLLEKTDPRGIVGKTVDGALGMPKQIIAPLAGMIVEAASVPLYYGPRKLMGYKDKETDIIWNSSADLIQRQVNASNFAHRLFGQGEMKSILEDVKSWADKAQAGDELPDELDKKLSSAAYDGYFKFTDENARDVGTSRDTFSVNKSPALRAAMQRYLITADGSAFDGMLQMLSMTGNDRATQQQTMEYLERPQAATADTVIDRAKLLDMKLDAGRASKVLDIGKKLDTATADPAQYRNLITEAGKVLGLEKPADVQMALSHLTRQETDDPNSWRALFRAGTVANVGEFATEALSDVATGILTASVMGAPAAGAVKGAQVSARQGLKKLLSPVSTIRDKAANIIGSSLDSLAEKSARFATGRARLGSAITEAADKYRNLGIVHPAFGAPLTTAQKARNTAVGLTKSAVAAAPIEAVEEGAMALLDAAPTPQGVVDSMVQGALGGTVLVPMFAGASALNRAWSAGKRNQSITDYKAGLVGKFNDRMAGQPGFAPLTVDDFDIMQGIQDNPAHQSALQDHAAALDELAAAQEEHTAAVLEMQDAAAGNAVADAPPSPRLLAAQTAAQQTSDQLTGLASVAFSATDELRSLPADQRPLYTGIAKATSGATDYTTDEARALIGLGGQSAIAFQQAQVLPADVAGPANVTTLTGAPAVSQTVIGTYRLPTGVRIQVPQQAIDALYDRAPSLRGLISPSAAPMPQAQTADVSPAPAVQQTQPTAQPTTTQQPAPAATTEAVAAPAQGQVVPPAVTPAVQPAATTPASPAARAAENITRQVIGAVAAKSPKLKSLIKEAKKPNAYPTGGFWMKPDGTIAYHMPTVVQQLAGMEPQVIAQQVAALLDEEIRHAANMEAAQKLWKQKGINPLGVNFEDWRSAWYGDIWLNHFTQEMRDKVAEAYGNTLPEQDWMRAMEGLRMLDQLRATGSITESVLRALDAVLAALRDFLGLVTAGSKPIVQREIDAIAAVLAEFGYENGTVQPAKAKQKAAKPQAAKKTQEKTESSVKTPKSSTQLTLSPVDAAPIIAFGESIPKDKLSPEIIVEDGTALETEPHVTVLYGLTKHEADPVAKAIAGHGPITVTLGKMSLFESENYDVLKIDVESPELRALNAKLSKLPNENSFPDYRPHMTIAYLKKGEGKEYVGNSTFEGKQITFNTMTFSPPSELRGKLGKPELPLNSQAITPATTNTTTDENPAKRQEENGQGRQEEGLLVPPVTEPAATAPESGSVAAPVASEETQVLASAPVYPIAPQLNLKYSSSPNGTEESSPAEDDAKRAESNPLAAENGNSRGGEGSNADGQQRFPSSPSALLSWAKENGWLIDIDTLVPLLTEEAEIRSGDEHDVWFNAASQRAIKITIDNEFVQGSPFAYAQNLARQNDLFQAGYAFEGIADDEGNPRIVISQPWVVGSSAEQQAKDAYFKSKGFDPVSQDSYYSIGKEMLVTDARSPNVIQRTDGTVQPIDVQVKAVSLRQQEVYENRVAAYQTLASAPVRGYQTPASMLEATRQTMQGMKQPAAVEQPKAPAITPRSMLDAYRAATVGKSSAMVPIKDVFEKAKAANPELEIPDFLDALKEMDDGRALFIPADDQRTYNAAKPFVYGAAANTMAFSPELVKASTILSNLDRVKEKRDLLPPEQDAYDKAGALLAPAASVPQITHVMPDGYALTSEGMQTLNSAPVRAFHGTPHKVKKFSLDKIGTGEGAQAYGWGLYFAGNKAVAQQYQKGLTERDFIRKVREEFSEHDNQEEAMRLIRDLDLSEGQRALIDALEKEDWWGFDFPHQAVQAAIREPQNFDPGPDVTAALEKFGNLYTVDLLPNEDDFLDWDKPLSEQSGKVKAAILKEFPRLDKILPSWMESDQRTTDPTGKDLYQMFANRKTGDSKAIQQGASKMLADAGIPGIRYLDGNSRTAGEGTHNYVLFDENLVRIIAENGKPVDAQPEPMLASAPTQPTPDADKKARIREIVDSMPPTWQNVLRDTWAGKSIEQIAQERNLKPEAVRNVQVQALGRFKVLMDKGAAPKVTVQVENGTVKAAGGRPDLAMSGNAAVAAVDQRRMTPEEVTHADMQEAAAQMFAADPAAAEKLVTRWMDSGTTVLSTAGMPESIQRIVDAAQARMAAEMLMTAAAKLLVTEKALKGGSSLETARLIDLYRNTGTEQARALNMRRDPFDTPEERAAMYLSETLLTPPAAIRAEMKKNPANKERILAAWAQQADKIKAEMLAAGIDLDATFREMAKEKKLAEETIPEPVKQPLARAPKKTRQLVKAILEGKTWQEAMNAAGLTLAAARTAYNGFRAELNKIAANAAAQAKDELLRSAPVVDFAAGLGLPEWTDAVDLNQNAVKTTATEKLRLQRERKKAGGEIDLKDPLSTNRARRLIEERKSNFFDKISEYWRASILSGPQTHVVNVVSGLTYGTYEATFKKLSAAVQADIARMFRFKPDAASLADIPAMIAGVLPAIKLAFLDSIRSWKSETGLFDQYAIQSLDDNGALSKESFSPALKGMLGKIMRGISFRLMGAADEFVKSFFTRIEVAAQARQIARNEGKTGAAMANAISELMEPGSLAWERALAQAKRITFQDQEVHGYGKLESPLQSGHAAIDGLIDGLANGITRAKKGDFGRALKGLSHFTFPFVSTPTNIFKAGVTMSPVGGLLAIIDATRSLHRRKQGNVEEAQRIYNAARALDDITNQIVAWGFILGLSALVKPGDDEDELPFITGTIPWRSTAPGERELAYRTAPPQSIRIGDKWYSYKRLDPFASALAFTIDAIREFQSGKPIDEVWGKVGMGMMTNLQDKTFLQGVSDLVNAIQDPQRFGTKWATNIAIGFLPNLIRQPARTSDSVFRENDLPNDMGFWEVMERRIGFGLFPADSNPFAPMPAVDIWGRPAAKNTGTGGPNTDWMMRLFSPVEMRDAAQPDPLDVALLRYNMTHDEPFGVSAPSRELQKTMDGKPVKISLRDPEYLAFVTAAGQAARAAIGDTYNGRDLNEDDIDAIKKTISKVQSEHRNQVFFTELAKQKPQN